ncbi:MAG: 30S ribosome-binding factor RbfA [Clostridia bacterium]|nr:30S ribosome-binding factor RbfA [Clostridia bacterium]MBR3294883.1 30S ribosome-binding factor RbfA [Clostridia bacterium]
MSVRRTQKIDGELQKVLGEIFMTDIKDPRFSRMTGVLRVNTTQDLKYAKVYVSIYDSEENVKSTMEALESAEPFIRAKINEKMRLRRIPNLQFVHDTSIEYSIEISKKIAEVTAKDRENARNRGEDPDEE